MDGIQWPRWGCGQLAGQWPGPGARVSILSTGSAPPLRVTSRLRRGVCSAHSWSPHMHEMVSVSLAGLGREAMEGFWRVAGERGAHGSQEDSRNAVQSHSDCQILCERVFRELLTPLLSAAKLTSGCCVMYHRFVQNGLPWYFLSSLLGIQAFYWVKCQALSAPIWTTPFRFASWTQGHKAVQIYCRTTL